MVESMQAEKLREKLVSMKIGKDALWVSSPMTRALETMLLGCPQSSRIGARETPLNIAVRRCYFGQLKPIHQNIGLGVFISRQSLC